MKVIIIGGDAAGMSAASKLKRLKKDSDIVVYEKGGYLSYAACGLPYYAAGDSMQKESLIQRSKSDFEADGIRPMLFHEVLRIMPDGKRVLVRNLRTGETFEDLYDKLMIATGAHAVIPSVPGIGLSGVHTLHTIDDAAALKETLARDGTRDITIIGGGYIGVEAAEALAGAGFRVRMIQRPDTLIKSFDPDMAAFARQELERLGVTIKFKENLASVSGTDRVEKVTTDRDSYVTDAVLLATGIHPSTEFLQDSGIALAQNGAVVVDREMRTNLPDIYAAGDCAQIYHLLKEKNVYIALATTANKCGRIVGENLAGGRTRFVGTLGSAAIKVGGLEMARTGLSENDAKEMGLDYRTVTVKAANHPGYYPGSSPIWFKLIYENGTGRILGAQGAGRQGVVLRTDVFAAAIAGGMTTHALGMLDLCYAPPFSAPWDAVHIAANAAK